MGNKVSLKKTILLIYATLLTLKGTSIYFAL